MYSGSYHQHLTFVQIDTSCTFYEKHVSKAHIFDNLMMFEIFELRHEKTCFCISQKKDADQLCGNQAAD